MAERQLSALQLIKNEIEDYEALPPLSIGSSVMDWWRHHEPRLPHLAALAGGVLAAPASSATLERAFSHAGHAFNKRRAPRLDPDMAADIIFAPNGHDLIYANQLRIGR